ncbi:hypothetical protein DENSPDRAFT_489080 [Dentipellis sp. KUC8613]|nr:hypothetical protein DENSPDRAFT_489080 [Dentipellis sp. KUC8613]
MFSPQSRAVHHLLPVFLHSRHYATRRPRMVLGTLDPKRLQASDYWDISGKHSPLALLVHAQPRLARPSPSPTKHSSISLYAGGKGHESFPHNVRGFLYYHQPPNAPLDAEVRFRLTDTSDPAGFAHGTDLTMADGMPWNIALEIIAASQRHRPLCDFLVAEGLLKPDVLDVVRRGVEKRRTRPKRNSRLIAHLHQPFPLSLNARVSQVRIQSLLRSFDRRQCTFYVHNKHFRGIIHGAALVAFEPFVLPTHLEGRAVALRVLKITEPLILADSAKKLDFRVEEGQLLARGGVPYTLRVDDHTGRGRQLAMLFENEGVEDPFADERAEAKGLEAP